MTNSKKLPKKGKKATAVSRKSGPQKGDPDPTKGPPRKGRGRGKDDSKARRRRKRRTENPKPRDGKLDTEFTKVRAKEFMREAFAAVDANPQAVDAQKPARRAVPSPTMYTCSVGIGESDPRMSARPGGYSDAFRQEVVNSGSAQFAHVNLTATQWSNGLPASATEVRADGAGGAYVPLADGTAVAGGLGGGEVAPVWFRVNLTPHGGVQAGELVQAVTHQAVCGPPP